MTTQISKNTLLLGDCIEQMSELPPSSVDMILTDPPYGTTRCKWDTVIPFAPMWEQVKRLIKPNGAIVITSAQPFTTSLIHSNLPMFRYCWVWEKTQATGHFNAKKRPMVAHEDVCVFYSRPCLYNPQKTQGHKPMNHYTKKKEVVNRSEVYGKVRRDMSGGGETNRYPRSVQTFASDKQRNKLDGTIHPAQKPVALLEYLIRTYTYECDTVLDFCMGSGTTGVACQNLNRKFIGIENNQRYFELAVDRIADDTTQDGR